MKDENKKISDFDFKEWMAKNSWPVETPQTDLYIAYLRGKWPSYFFYDKSSSGHLNFDDQKGSFRNNVAC